MDAKTIADGFGQLTADATGTKVLPIEVPIVEGATSYTFVLPAQTLTADADTTAQHLFRRMTEGRIDSWRLV
ncbi:hypothetical protein [Paenibacillus sp. P36]|uniref:hypothetical protein n=1 Tax=Paenibacillus sp. P36 TaxID=3342538 RepID=UPI0038B294AD